MVGKFSTLDFYTADSPITTGMCKEHLGIALALKIPCFFVITKIDICPEHIFNNTMKSLHAILKKPGVKKIPVIVRNQVSWAQNTD